MRDNGFYLEHCCLDWSWHNINQLNGNLMKLVETLAELERQFEDN